VAQGGGNPPWSGAPRPSGQNRSTCFTAPLMGPEPAFKVWGGERLIVRPPESLRLEARDTKSPASPEGAAYRLCGVAGLAQDTLSQLGNGESIGPADPVTFHFAQTRLPRTELGSEPGAVPAHSRSAPGR
jgi:hypothetical protein